MTKPLSEWVGIFTTATGLMTSAVMVAVHGKEVSKEKIELFTRKLLRRLRRSVGNRKTMTWADAAPSVEVTLKTLLKELKGASHDPR